MVDGIEGDVLPRVIERTIKDGKLICFDEFQVCTTFVRICCICTGCDFVLEFLSSRAGTNKHIPCQNMQLNNQGPFMLSLF